MRILLLIDESEAMKSVPATNAVGRGRPLIDVVATAVNRLLRDLVDGSVEVVIVGYRADATGMTNIGTRWAGSLSGRSYVPSNELTAAARYETRIRRLPLPGGGVREEPVEFAVWYEPSASGGRLQTVARHTCLEFFGPNNDLNSHRLPHVVVHVFAGELNDSDAGQVVSQILGPEGNQSDALVVQCHLARSNDLIETAFPSDDKYVSIPSAARLMAHSSPLPAALVECLSAIGVHPNSRARAMVHNASTTMLGALMHALGQWIIAASSRGPARTPPRTWTSHHGLISKRHPLLIVLLLDQSEQMQQLDDNCGRTLAQKAADEANSWLQNLSISCSLCRGFSDSVHVSVLGYRSNEYGMPMITPALGGVLSGRTRVPISEIAEHPSRVDSITTWMTDEQTGEVLEMPQQLPIWIGTAAEGKAPLCAALDHVAVQIDAFVSVYGDAGPAPLVIHLTGGPGTDGNPFPSVDRLTARRVAAGHVLFLTEYFSTTGTTECRFPPDDQSFTDPVADLHCRLSSSMPTMLADFARYCHVEVAGGGRRCFAMNASLCMIVNWLGLGASEGSGSPCYYWMNRYRTT